MNIIEQFEKDQIKSLVKGKKIPQFHPGDTVRVNVKVRRGYTSREYRHSRAFVLERKTEV
jgi:Ribosomal protein L19